MNNQPIGVFDSGVGGLTVWKELIQLLPQESMIYYADSGRSPYGVKSYETIQKYCSEITAFLLSKGCKIIVIACNTATAAAIEYLRAKFDVPFIGMEPAIKPAVLSSKTKHVGVLATKGTLEGRLFNQTSEKYAGDVVIHIQIGEGLVSLVEQNNYKSEEAYQLIKTYLTPMIDQNIDRLVLGCTHYPFYESIFTEVLPENVKVLNPAPAVARRTIQLLNEFGISASEENEAEYTFHTSGSPTTLLRLVKKVTKKSFLVFEK